MTPRTLQQSCGCQCGRGVRLGMSNIDTRFNEPDDSDSVAADLLVRHEADEDEDEEDDEEEDKHNDDADDETDDGYSE